MDTIPVRLAGNPEFVTAQLFDENMASDPALPPGVPIVVSFTGPGTSTALANIPAGVRVAILDLSLAVFPAAGAGIGGGTVRLLYTQEGSTKLNVASQTSGNYISITSRVMVPAVASGGFQARNLLGGVPHVTIASDGATALFQIISTLAATDTGELTIVASPIIEGLSCQ